MKHETVVILDLGGSYTQLLARRIRELKVYCAILPHHASLAQIQALQPKALVLSGGMKSLGDQDALTVDPQIYRLGLPVLAIGYGMQLMANALGGVVRATAPRESSPTSLRIAVENNLFAGFEQELTVELSAGDRVETAPPGFTVLATTDRTPVAAMGNRDTRLYGVQFLPAALPSRHETTLLTNFLYKIAGLTGNWTPAAFIADAVQQIRETVGPNEQVVCGLSGGVDSSVAAVLVHQAIGDRLTCIFVDHGLLRKNEAKQVMETFTRLFKMKIIQVDAAAAFLRKLAGVSDPEQKRKIIGAEFIRVFQEEAAKLGPIDYLVQGTLYTDVLESGTAGTMIKSHHNVGGLPKDLKFKLIEPLNHLFKDEVRRVGEELGIPAELVWRHPFPGPGLAIRILGEVTPEKVELLREADAIFIDEIKKAGLYRDIWQAFAVLPDIRSVGVMDNQRTYAYTVALRAVTSRDGTTADWYRFPPEVLARIANRIVDEVPHVNRVVYDITSKPPSTIEWE
ncbi:MAG: glutamine-hydrolyzing GMP synthase [Firmicutes bacterium]|nr:glutamine-hydrolyzing GMP synthase [Bacillota bacterium]